MARIQDVMSHECEWISPEASVADAARVMAEKDIGFLPVGENDRLIGMITDRDITVRAVGQGKSPDSTSVRDIMTPKTFYCYDDQDVEDVCNNLGDIQVRRLPVVNREKRLVGVVSLGDLAQSATRANIGQTEQQITSKALLGRQAVA
ncbi:MAG: CBS domain-containing protein [Alphaproteobacteria bacterium]|nr:CBS domain-containing protein [Alphaproteobacteria bacterium]